MAHFRGTTVGDGTIASRLGTVKTGIVSEANGWNIGGRVEIEHIDGKDRVLLHVTGGSNNSSKTHTFGPFVEGML